MKILFDQNIPRDLANFLPGHQVVRTAQVGWDRLKNGDLLNKAEENAFDAMVTADQSLAYQQNLSNRRIAIVSLTANNWPLIEPHVSEIARAVDHCAPGDFITVVCSRPQTKRK